MDIRAYQWSNLSTLKEFLEVIKMDLEIDHEIERNNAFIECYN